MRRGWCEGVGVRDECEEWSERVRRGWCERVTEKR